MTKEAKKDKTEKKTEEKKQADKTLTKSRDNAGKVEEKKEEKKEEIIVPNFVTRIKIAKQITHGKLTLSQYSNFDEIVGNGVTIIEGFPNGNSITNIITTSHIIDHLKLQLVGEITSEEFPPLTVVQKGVPASGARLYANKQIVVISSEYSVKEASIQHDLVQLILKFAETHKAAAILTIDALSGNPSEATTLLDQIQLSTDAAGEEGGLGYDDDHGDFDDYVDNYMYKDVKENIVEGEKDLSSEFAKTPKKNQTLKLAKEEDSKKATTKTITKSIAVPSDGASQIEKADEDEEKTNIWFMTNEQKFGEFFKGLEYEPVVEVSLSGVQAGLINRCRFVETPIILLLARLDKLELGARPALLLIQTIEKLLKFMYGDCDGIDISQLEESTNTLEAKLNDLLMKLQPPVKDESANMLYM